MIFLRLALIAIVIDAGIHARTPYGHLLLLAAGLFLAYRLIRAFKIWF